MMQMSSRIIFVGLVSLLGIFMIGRNPKNNANIIKLYPDVHGDVTMRGAYLDLMREVVLNTIYEPAAYKQDGSSWSPQSKAFSMLGRRRIDNVRQIVEAVVEEQVEGDVLETGVWRGGGMFFAAAVLRSLGELGRRQVILCDSFNGIPEPTKTQHSLFLQDRVAHKIPLGVDNSPELVLQRYERLLLPKAGVRLVVGFFNESLPNLVRQQPPLRLAVLRLDGDTYFSTIEALRTLYDYVSEGGYIIVDDYPGWEGCMKAVHDFRVERDVKEVLVTVHHERNEQIMGIFWRKGSNNDPCVPLRGRTVKWDTSDVSGPTFEFKKGKHGRVYFKKTGGNNVAYVGAIDADVLHRCNVSSGRV